MSRRTNRRQISPVRIKPNAEPRRGNYNSEVQRIINHAAKLISEYNKSELEKLMDEDLDNQKKISKLLRESKVNLPKISLLRKFKKPKIKKRKLSTSQSQNLEVEIESSKGDCNVNYNSPDEIESNDSVSGNEKSASQKMSTQISLPLSTETDRPVQDYSSIKSSDNPITDRKSENFGTLSQLSLEKSVLCSICSPKEQTLSYKEENNEKELNFNYEIEIKTGDKDNSEKNIKVFIQLYGETNSMKEPICLNHVSPDQTDSNLFRPGNLDKFLIGLQDFIGSIINVQIGLENEGVLWNLDYLCVRDIQSKKDYFFSCRRCLGTDSPDKLIQITLGYTPPYKVLKHHSLSNANTESMDNKRDNIPSSRSSKSHYSQQNESNHLSDQIMKKSYNGNENITDNEHSDRRIIEKSTDNSSRRPISQNSDDSRHSIHSKSSSSSSSLSNDIIDTSNRNSPQREKINSPSCESTDIFTAIRSHDVEAVKRLCNSNNHRIDVDENGCSPIHLAGIYYEDKEECKEIIKHLISHNVDINYTSSDGLISLHYAVLNNNLPAVKFLIEHCEAGPDILDRNGNSSIQLASINDFDEIVNYLENVKENQSTQIQNVLHNVESDKQPKVDDNILRDTERKFSTQTYRNMDNNTNSDFIPDTVSVEAITSEYNEKEKRTNNTNDIDKENVETDEDKSIVSENKSNSSKSKTSSSIVSDDSKKSQNKISSKSTAIITKDDESENSEEIIPLPNNPKVDLIIPDDDNLDNLEKKQYEAEDKGIMFHKEIPDPYQNKATRKSKPSKKLEECNDELSVISSKSNTSSVSTRVATLSPITSRSHSDSSLSNMDENNQPKLSEKPNNNYNIIENSYKNVDGASNHDNNQEQVDKTELENNPTQSENNLIEKQQDPPITNGKFSPNSNSS